MPLQLSEPAECHSRSPLSFQSRTERTAALLLAPLTLRTTGIWNRQRWHRSTAGRTEADRTPPSGDMPVGLFHMRSEDVTKADRELFCDLCGDAHPTFVMGESSSLPPGGDALCALCEEHLREGNWEKERLWLRSRHGTKVGSAADELLAGVARPKWDYLRNLLTRAQRPRPI